MAPVAGDARVAGQRQLEAAAEAEALDRRDHEARVRLQLVHQRLAAGVGGEPAGAVERRQLLDVLARAEGRLAAAAEHDRAHRRVGGQRRELAAEPVDGGHVERVAALRAVDAQLADHERP